MLPKNKRITKNEDFTRVYQKGKYFSSGNISIKYADNGLEISRIGIAVGKNFSKKAVDRNRAKRVLRASSSEFMEIINPGFDIVIMCRNVDAKTISAKETTKALKIILQRNKLIK